MGGQFRPPLSILKGQLKLGLKEEIRKETLLEETLAFARCFVIYAFRRLRGATLLPGRVLSLGFALLSAVRFAIQKKLYRRKGQLAFPLAHTSLLGVSFSLFFFTSGLGEFLYREVGQAGLSESGALIVADQPPVATEESQLLKTAVETYVVQKGDTLYDIAERFRVTVDALAYANNLSDPDSLKIGEELTIPPVEGLLHKVKKGDTVESIAKTYKADPQRIVEFNYLFPPYELAIGTELIVPYAQIPQPPKPTAPSSPSATSFAGILRPAPAGACGPLSLGWPTASRSIVGGYTYYHRGIDFAVNYAPLYAAADGVVTAVASGFGICRSFSKTCNYGYGNYVFIDIGGGYQIRYGHISTPLVGVGQHVSRGEVVAISGESGMAFAPHLHFELLCGKSKINPVPYLR